MVCAGGSLRPAVPRWSATSAGGSTGLIASVGPATRRAVVVVAAKSPGRKIFGLATADVRLA